MKSTVKKQKKKFNYTQIFRKQPSAASIWLTFGEDEALAETLAWTSYRSHQQLTYRMARLIVLVPPEEEFQAAAAEPGCLLSD